MNRAAALIALTLLACLPFLAPCVLGADAPSTQPVEPGSRVRISILTMSPGDASWEKFGHIAIRIQDPDARIPDVAFHWGLFDFNQKNFYANFVQGRMLYSAGAFLTQPMLDEYAGSDRTIYEQELNLTPAQTSAVIARCLHDVQPAFRDYRYDYYRDNLATRVRDLVDGAVGGEIASQTQNVPTGTTYRSHTRRLTADDLPLYLALHTLLGRPADRPISAWEEMFIPMQFRDHLRHVTVLADSGRRVPIVREERILHAGHKPPERTRPPNFVPPFLAAGVAVAALCCGLSVLGRRRRGARVALGLLGVFWAALLGAGGVAILWIAWFTDHAAGYRNENLLHVSPLLLPLVVLLPRAIGGHVRAARVAFALVALATAGAVIGVVLKATPWFYQVNWDIIALTLPVYPALLWILWQRVGASRRTHDLPVKGAMQIAS